MSGRRTVAALTRTALHAPRLPRTGQVRWCTEKAKPEGDAKEGDGKKSGLGAHFGEGQEHKESALLKAFVAVGQTLENAGSILGNTALGGIILPKHQQKHSWGKVEREEIQVEEDEETGRKTIVNAKKKSNRVEGVPINEEQFAVIAVGEVVDHTQKETAWSMFSQLLTSKAYKTTQQQATDRLYKCIPDYNEPEFLEDIEHNLMPAFLDAFWAKDKEALHAMCTDACYHLHVETYLKQYEHMKSNCRLLMTRRANCFNRLMFIDDSDHAPSVRRRAELAEKGVDLDEMDDLDVEEEKPEAIFFVSCSAHIENEWTCVKTGEVKVGSKNDPEDWFFVFGLTPQPGPTWTLSSLEFQRMQAMGGGSASSESRQGGDQ
eukprot:TRINITY_DN808_c0_g2_i1.p1 TRINITY_DN808_c0_g2~~TRINITY_DN808_c0_g2_i1.p1  ORF type:complete len:376 (+),score=149.60 TRINITY_DN808_c0_g2_i1:95-1222(+)